MTDVLNTLLESSSPVFNEAVSELFHTLFETASSKDTVAQLAQKVGQNIHKVDDGSKIVGLAAKSGMDGDALPPEEDELVNNAEEVANTALEQPELPTEKGMEGLPNDGGTEDTESEFAEEPEDTSNDLSGEEFENISDNPPPDDFEVPPLDLGDESFDDGSTEPTEDISE